MTLSQMIAALRTLGIFHVSDEDEDREYVANQVHRWVGEAHMAATGRLNGPGTYVEYTEVDLRRAVAYLRTRALIGAGVGTEAMRLRERIRDVAAENTDGWIVVSSETRSVSWVPTRSQAAQLLTTGHAVVLIPCRLPEALT